ncbi:MAG TPA: Na+/H+ antiporter [Mucilaginibacter sp.]
MHQLLFICIGLILSISFLVLLAKKLKIAYPIFLVLAGLALGFIPAVPTIRIDPDLVFLVILPPILFDAAWNSSWRAMWHWRRIILVMAIGFVLLTSTVVAFLSCVLIPGITLAEGFMLGAIISPPDTAAATAVLQYVKKLPKGMVSILEGESLLNDATSLTVFRFSIAAIASSDFLWYHAVGGFALVVVSGIAIGLAFGAIFYAIYRWLPTSSNLDFALSLVMPYLIYLSAEAVHSSGVLATVSGGLFIAYQNHFIFNHSSRLKSTAIWPAIVFILNAVIFFLIGLQLPEIAEGIKSLSFSHSITIALIIAGAVILTRLCSAYISSIFTSFISRFIKVAVNHPGWRNPTVIGWTGMRGVVSLASALAIPLMLNGKPFPYRNLILFITFTVIVVTLVGQGLILPWIIRKVKPETFEGVKSDDEQLLEIERHLHGAALKELETAYTADLAENALIKNKLDLLRAKCVLYDGIDDDSGKLEKLQRLSKRFKHVMVLLTEHQRRALHHFRHQDHIDDDVIALVERRLDLEEERLEEESE